MKDPKESNIPVDSHIIDPVGAVKITQNIEFDTQLMKAHTKGGLGFMAEDANSLHDSVRTILFVVPSYVFYLFMPPTIVK